MLFKKSKQLKEFLEIASKYEPIVNKQVKKRIKELEITDNLVSNISTDRDYLIYFAEYLRAVQSRITGKPDSFIIAACLFKSILFQPVVKTSKKLDILENSRQLLQLKSINSVIALNSALEIISEPITYHYDSKFSSWIQENHEKVEICIPAGVIKDSPLEERFLVTAVTDLFFGVDVSIMQISNFFHLIYLYCL